MLYMQLAVLGSWPDSPGKLTADLHSVGWNSLQSRLASGADSSPSVRAW
jgi:hypothetical protein